MITLLLITPPTPNGDLHVGHLSGPYLAGDIHRRYLRLRGVETYSICGSDDHQTYVDFKASQLNSTPQEVATRFGDLMHQTLQAADIEIDVFARSQHSQRHIKLVQDFFAKLYDDGKLVARDAPSLYCDACAKFVFEAYVRGHCPHCGAISGGNACEDCGRPNDCVDLGEPKCNHCGGRPSIRTYKRLYFPLGHYEEQLREYFKTATMNTHLRALCDRMLADGLPDIPVSHISDWGITVPVAGFDGQRIYVWFEMAPGYLAATEQLTEQLGLAGGWQRFWHDVNIDFVQFFGFDNGYFFAVLFPALYMAYDAEIKLPRISVTNEFYRLDGLKFSTSRNHAIWGQQILKDEPSDTVRFHLAYTGPERRQTNFTMDDYRNTVQRELVDEWQAWLQALGVKASTVYDGSMPDIAALPDNQRQFYETIERLRSDAASAYEPATFSPQRATRILCELARTAHNFGAAEDHWQGIAGREAERQSAIVLELLAAKVLASMSAPLMPNFAARLWQDLGYDPSQLNAVWPHMLEWVPGDRKFQPPAQPYFSAPRH